MRLWEPTSERAPFAVAPGVDARFRVLSAVCGEWSGARGDVPRIRIVRLDRHRPRVVAVATGVRGLPRFAAVVAPGGTATSRLVRAPLGDGVPGERMDVALGAGAMVLPRGAAVGGAHQPAQLDPNEEEVGVVRAGRDPAHVRGPRPRREAPGRLRRQL